MSRTKKKEGAVRGKTTNRIINILLVLGCLTILFPLYMTVIIAFKKPSEMTNDVAGALAFPQKWSFENFAEAMRVTDFWHSLGNSLLITGVTVVLCILIHSLAGYLIGRKMKQRKIFKISYYYIVSGMFVPFAVLMMPLVKETAQLGIANRFGVIVLYVVFFMPMNILLYSGYLNFQTQFGTNYNLAFASYLLALLPILIFYIICQKQIINGVVNGAVK